MNKMYKIFGAVAVIGLFLLCSMSTGLAAQGQQQQQQVKVQVDGQEIIMIDPQVATYQDVEYGYSGTYALPGFPGETTPYPTGFGESDLCTTLILRYKPVGVSGSVANVLIRVRNVGLTSISAGGTLHFIIRDGLWISQADRDIPGPMGPLFARTYIFGQYTPFLLPHLVLVHLNVPDDPAGIRSFNWRVGAVLPVLP